MRKARKKSMGVFFIFCMLWIGQTYAESYLDNTYQSEPIEQSQATASVRYLSPKMEADLQSYLSGRLYAPFSTHYDKVNRILTRIENGIVDSGNDPKWWYYKGLAHRALAYVRFQELKSDKGRFSDEQRKQQITEQNESQRRVLELDNEDMPTLSLREYDTLASGMAEEARIDVYRRMLKYPNTKQKDEVMLKRIEQEYATTLEQLGRYDDAIALYENMKYSQGDPAVGANHAQDITRIKVAKELKNKEALSADNINDRANKLQTISSQQPVDFSEQAIANKESFNAQVNQKGEANDGTEIPLIWYVVVALIGVLLVLLWFAYYLIVVIKQFVQKRKEAKFKSKVGD